MNYDFENSFLCVYLSGFMFFYKSLHNLIYFNIRNRKFVAISAENFTQIRFRGFGKKILRGTLVPRFTHLPSLEY
jgi:hypothetical protein